MKLKEMLKNVEVLETRGSLDKEIKSLSLKADAKNTDGLFFCYKGVEADGHDFFAVAENNGAAALIVERFLPTQITQIKVKNTRASMGQICSDFYGNPSKKLRILGVSGTNGKTTTTYILREILKAAGFKVGLIGTSAVYINEICYPASLTTPDPPELHRLFFQMLSAGCDTVVMEVSAHAMDLLKLAGIKFEAGIFTNLTQDHLDYFKTMKDYANAKQKFFMKEYCNVCVFNADDSTGRDFFKKCDATKFTYGLINPSDAFAVNLKMNLTDSSFVCNVFDNILNIDLKLAGKFNVYNTLGAVLACKALKVPDDAILTGTSSLTAVEGRFNVYDCGGVNVVIDYAHTPDGLENILKNVKALLNKKGRLICVFGCGGNRDKTKRPIMGEIAVRYSNSVIVTSDNPRFEKPEDIIEQIKLGITHDEHKVMTVAERKNAIFAGLKMARAGDAVVICGKGAEDYQEINGIKYPFKDRAVMEEYFNNAQLTIENLGKS